MKNILLLVVAALAVVSFAEEAKKAETGEKKRPTRAEIEQRPEVQRRTGGFIDAKAKGVAILVLDLRPKAGGAGDQFAKVFKDLSKANVVVEKTPLAEKTCPIETLAKRQAETKAVFAMAIVSCPKMSGLMTLPEDRLVVVNAAKYQEGEDPVRREERVIKELWRGLGFASGIGYAPFKNDVFQPVFSVKELDELEYQVMQPMNFQKMYGTMHKFGATRERHIPYRLACKEGWAPAPTNDYQRAVWSQVFDPPKNPMKIEFDPKKGR